jgi:hypothetical protein
VSKSKASRGEAHVQQGIRVLPIMWKVNVALLWQRGG